MIDDHERSLATYYAMVLRSRGYSPERAAEAVVQRYPGVRAQLEKQGLLKPLRSDIVRWTDPALHHLLEFE